MSEVISPSEGQFRISAVASLTGIPVPTIRMWERRYQVVDPARSAANGRLYSREDVERLTLLKRVVDRGFAIGTVARLPRQSLVERLGADPLPVARATDACRVLVVGAALGRRLELAWGQRKDLDLHLVSPGMEILPNADVLVLEAPTVHGATLREIRRLRQSSEVRSVLVVYAFATKQTLARMDQEGIVALSAPVEPGHVARLCRMARAMPSPEPVGAEKILLQPIAPRHYSDVQLAQIAQMQTDVRCECPQHLSDLLIKLNAFERYSQECEQATASDAAIHALLYATSAQCRNLLEQALTRVMEWEQKTL